MVTLLCLRRIVDEVIQNIHYSSYISDGNLLILYQIFGSSLLDALSCIESRSIVKQIGQRSAKTNYIVRGSVAGTKNSDASYICLSNYCACMFYSLHVINKKSAIMCKHQLAIALAVAMNCQIDEVFIKDECLFAGLL